MATDTTERKHESPEIGSMIKRMVRALVKRAAEGDLEALQQLQSLDQDVPQALTIAGQLMHEGRLMATQPDGSTGYSYTELGDALMVSRQAARRRFSSSPSPTTVAYYTSWPAPRGTELTGAGL